MDRASDSGSEGWGFESLPVYQINKRDTRWVSLLFISRSAREGTRIIKSQYAGGILLPPVQTLVATLISAQRAEMQTSPFGVTLHLTLPLMPQTNPFGVTPHLTLPLMGQPSPFVIFAPHLIQNTRQTKTKFPLYKMPESCYNSLAMKQTHRWLNG